MFLALAVAEETMAKKESRKVPLPDMFTVDIFAKHINDCYGHIIKLTKRKGTGRDGKMWDEDTISEDTARLMLIRIGFHVTAAKVILYYDGHNRDCVVVVRVAYVARLLQLWPRVVKAEDTTHLLAKPADHVFTDDEQAVLQCTLRFIAGRQERPVVLLFLDESTFYSNDFNQSQKWSKVGEQKVGIKTKAQGASLMVSAWICLPFVVPHYDTMECGSVNGWWTTVQMTAHVAKLLDIVAPRATAAECIAVLDNSSNHKKFAYDALSADNMNLGPGGHRTDKYKVKWYLNYRLGEWNGVPFDMMKPNPAYVITAPGTADPPPQFIPKGVDAILLERLGDAGLLGDDGKQLDAQKRRDRLNSHPDFLRARPIVQEQIEACPGWSVWFLPKYHCELNPIELLWCTAKRLLRSRLNGTIGSLRAHVTVVMGEVKHLWVAKWFRHCLSYVRGYAKYPLVADIQMAFKYVRNHSHRRAPQKNSLITLAQLDNFGAEGTIAGTNGVRLAEHFFNELGGVPDAQERADCEEDLLRHNMQHGMKSPARGIIVDGDSDVDTAADSSTASVM
jgi:hypothetical protein